jgi:hypothetical protein
MTILPYTIIVPVWGAVHVARFLEWALPTWLSPGNLPGLAVRGPVDLLLLTSQRDFAAIENDPITARARACCNLKLVAIDDLLPGNISTVTLTLAFTRGVNLALAEGCDRRLIFLNGDFLLSDGSLASIANRFEAGQQLLLCSSVRVREELVSDDFLRMRRDDGTMVLPSREAVGLALGALHPTVLACRVDQSLLCSAHPNQFFWKPDDSSLVLRAFLLFPLAVAPTQPPGPADTYCDYGWISTMAERASVDIVDNTDELFIVELAPTAQEIDFVRSGAAVIEDCAQRMSPWMTEFSAAQGDTPIIFRTRDGSDAAIAETIEVSGRFVAALKRSFGPLHPVRNHPYWQAGVASYLRNRAELGIASLPPEIAPATSQPAPEVARQAKLRGFAKRLVIGARGNRRPWHPYYGPERIVKGLGPLKPVGPVGLLDQLAVPRSERGTPISIVEFHDWQNAERAVARLHDATAPDQLAYLVVVNDAYVRPGELSIRERIAALAIIERNFQIISLDPLMTRVEVQGVAWNRRLALELQRARPLSAVGMVLASAFTLSHVLCANLLKSDGRRLAVQSDILLLRLKRGGGEPGNCGGD